MSISEAFVELRKYVSMNLVQDFISKKLNVSFEEAGHLMEGDAKDLNKRMLLVQTIATGCTSEEEAEKQICLELIHAAMKTCQTLASMDEAAKQAFLSHFKSSWTRAALDHYVAKSKVALLALIGLESQL